ncbi:MAG TPA: hypothetical protein VJ596_07520, partial [Gemmatimonadaceae bacterium]|nr:hypothetical protein [Gemmatimonadaceae bacterium]
MTDIENKKDWHQDSEKREADEPDGPDHYGLNFLGCEGKPRSTSRELSLETPATAVQQFIGSYPVHPDHPLPAFLILDASLSVLDVSHAVYAARFVCCRTASVNV